MLSFPELSVVGSRISTLPPDAVFESAEFQALGVTWKLVVTPNGTPNGAHSALFVLRLVSPNRTVVPGRVLLKLSGVPQAPWKELPRTTFSTVEPLPAGAVALSAEFVVRHSDLTTGAGARARPVQPNGVLSVDVCMRAATAAAATEAVAAREEFGLRAQVEAMRTSGVGYDVTFIFPPSAGQAAPEPMRAHSFILAARSGMFRDMMSQGLLPCSEPLKVREGMSVEAFHTFLRFLYKDFSKFSPTTSTEVVAELLDAGEVYRVPKLVLHCEQTLAARLAPDNMLRMLKLADSNLPRAVLRDAALRFVAAHFQSLADSDDWAALMHEHPRLATDVTLTLSSHGQPPEWKPVDKRPGEAGNDAAAAPKRPRGG